MLGRGAGTRDDDARQLYQGAAAFLAIYGAGSCLSFAVHVFLARSIGAASYGRFALATHWLAILAVVATVGLKPTVLRFAAAHLARREWAQLEGLLRTATRWVLGASALTVLVTVAAGAIAGARFDEAGLSLLIVVMALPFHALSDVWSAAVRGLGAVSRSQLPASIVQHLLFGAGLAILLAGGLADRDAVTAAIAFFVASIGAMVVAGVLMRAQRPGPSREAGMAYARREWAAVAWDNLLISLLQATRAPLIVVIMAPQVGPQQLAYYVAATRLANVMLLGLTGISGMATPQIARCFALSDRAGLQRLAHLAARGALASAALVGAALLAFGKPLLDLFGAGFESAFIALLVLAAGELVAAASGPVGYFLSMTGRQRTATMIEAVSSACAVGLALVLIPMQGIVGAAWAVALAVVLRNVAMVVAVQRSLAIRSAVI